MQILGPVEIGTVVESAESIDASFNKTIIQQPSQGSQIDPREKQGVVSSSESLKESKNTPHIRLKEPESNKDGLKSNLFRVIGALYLSDYFVNDKGERPNQKDVFIAFGNMLGEDYSRYDKQLDKIRNCKNGEKLIDELFKSLADAAVVFSKKEGR